MNICTQVCGIIEVETLCTKDGDKVLEEFIKTLPEVSGDDSSLEYYINQEHGFNTIEYTKNDGRIESQTVYVVALVGELVGRELLPTIKLLENVLEGFRQRFCVKNYAIKAIDESNVHYVESEV